MRQACNNTLLRIVLMLVNVFSEPPPPNPQCQLPRLRRLRQSRRPWLKKNQRPPLPRQRPTSTLSTPRLTSRCDSNTGFHLVFFLFWWDSLFYLVILLQDDRKMFIGGLSWETTVDEMKEYFAKYGDVKDAGKLFGDLAVYAYWQVVYYTFANYITQCNRLPSFPIPSLICHAPSLTLPVIKLDPYGRSRGFGFILFADSPSVEKVLTEESHSLKNKKIEPKKVGALGVSSGSRFLFLVLSLG